jgi:hypothetical protein
MKNMRNFAKLWTPTLNKKWIHEAAFIEGPTDETVPVVYIIEGSLEPACDIIIQLQENELVECYGNHQEDVPLEVTQEYVIFFFVFTK